MESIETIEAALTIVDHEYQKALARKAQHADKQKALAFDAHSGDRKARELLDAITSEGDALNRESRSEPFARRVSA